MAAVACTGLGGAGAKWHYEGTIADPGGGMFFLFCKLFEQYSQTNFSIITTKPFKAKYKKYGRYLGKSG